MGSLGFFSRLPRIGYCYSSDVSGSPDGISDLHIYGERESKITAVFCRSKSEIYNKGCIVVATKRCNRERNSEEMSKKVKKKKRKEEKAERVNAVSLQAGCNFKISVITNSTDFLQEIIIIKKERNFEVEIVCLDKLYRLLVNSESTNRCIWESILSENCISMKPFDEKEWRFLLSDGKIVDLYNKRIKTWRNDAYKRTCFSGGKYCLVSKLNFAQNTR